MAFNFEDFVKKYDVHPETISFLKLAAASGAKPYYEIGVDAARQSGTARNKLLAGEVEFEGSETELFVPSSEVKDGIPVTVYKPRACETNPKPSILVYFHGGGNVVGSRVTHEAVCKIMARDSPCIVVNVEYRLAPEHKFPANNDDAKCVVEWVAKNKTAVGGDACSKLGVSGDSAGGKLAAVVSHEAHQVIDFAVLIYPNVNTNFPHPSVKEFAAGPVLNYQLIEWFMDLYITEEDKNSPRASVIKNKEFSYLPPTLIIVAELDPLRDGCYEYYDTLKKTGVDVQLKTIKGVPHAFWGWPGTFKTTCAEAHGAATDFIRSQS